MSKTFWVNTTDPAAPVHLAAAERESSTTDPGTGAPSEVQVSVPGSADNQRCFAFYSPSGEPNSADWPAASVEDPYQLSMDVVTAGGSLTYGARVSLGGHRARVNGGLTADLESEDGSFIFSGTGIKVGTDSVSDPAAGSASDRYEFLVGADNSNMMAQTLGINVNTSDTFLKGPWSAGTAVGKALQAIFHVRAPAGRSLQAIYHVRAVVGKSLQAVFRVRSFVGKALQAIWHVQAPVGKSVEAIWNIGAAVGKSLQAVFNVAGSLSAVGKDLQAIFHVRALAGRSLEVRWRVAALAGRSLQAIFHVRAAAAKSLQAIFHVRAGAGKSLQVIFGVRVLAGKALELPWRVAALAGRSLQGLWHVRAGVGASTELRWRVSVSVGSSRQLVFHVRGPAGRALVALWNVVGPAAASADDLDPETRMGRHLSVRVERV